MKKTRLDIALTQRGLTTSRSQSESLIKLGKVTVDSRVVMKPGHFVGSGEDIKLSSDDQYVSRAGLKLASVTDTLKLNFKDKIVLDVGSSTGGFTDYALRHGAKKVYAVDVGTEQLHPSLRSNKRIELHEKTDIRSVYEIAPDHLPLRLRSGSSTSTVHHLLNDIPDIVLIDVSFISLRDILPHIHKNLSGSGTQIIAMVKPQFEAGKDQTNKGIIKNESIRRQILRDFENWAKSWFVIANKRDSDIAGAKGNQERFYLLSHSGSDPEKQTLRKK